MRVRFNGTLISAALGKPGKDGAPRIRGTVLVGAETPYPEVCSVYCEPKTVGLEKVPPMTEGEFEGDLYPPFAAGGNFTMKVESFGKPTVRKA